MSVRQFIALGTSSQVPTRKRNHNGYFLRWDDRGLLFDPGEGTQRQMTFFGVAASDIHCILITHLHGDHCLGLAGILQRISLDRAPQVVDLIYPLSGKPYIENLKNASIYDHIINLREHAVNAPGLVLRDSRFCIEAYPLDHSVDCYGYRVIEPDSISLRADLLAEHGVSGPSVGILKRQGFLDRPGRPRLRVEQVSVPRVGMIFGFLMDTRVCDGATHVASNADLLVSEATYLSTETAEAIARGHLTASQAATIAAGAGVKALALTHFSQRYIGVDEFVAEARPIHSNVVALEDGMSMTIPRWRQATLSGTMRAASGGNRE